MTDQDVIDDLKRNPCPRNQVFIAFLEEGFNLFFHRVMDRLQAEGLPKPQTMEGTIDFFVVTLMGFLPPNASQETTFRACEWMAGYFLQSMDESCDAELIQLQ